jgi:hypothetical protein
MRNKAHNSTMTSYQRKELFRILKMFHRIEELAVLTDPELHELWIKDCEYPNPYKNKRENG